MYGIIYLGHSGFVRFVFSNAISGTVVLVWLILELESMYARFLKLICLQEEIKL